MASEIRALSRQETANVRGRRVLVGDVTPVEVARRWAARPIGEKRVVDATATHLYARAEAKAARAAERAILDGDRTEALRQKRVQMLNHALYIEARRAADDAERAQRVNEVDRDMRDALRDLHGDHGPLATVGRFSMMGVAMLDMASALPTWVAAHTEALKRGMDDADAIYAADQSVRNAHGAGGAKDHSAIQRGSEVQKLFTMFYSFRNPLYTRQRDLFRDAKNIRSVGDFGAVLARSFFHLVVGSDHAVLHANPR